MTSSEMMQIADSIGIGAKELAHLLGISERTILRGVQSGGIIDLVLRDLREGLADPKDAQSIRALAIISARSGGLRTLLLRLRKSYSMLDRLSMNPNVRPWLG